MSDERENVINTLIEISVNRGIVPYDQDKVLEVFSELADLERDKPEHRRTGFSYALDNLEATGITKILNQAKARWPSTCPLQRKPTGIHKNECVISVKLDKNYNPDDLTRIFHDYVVKTVGLFDCNVIDCKHVYDKWYDLLVQYSVGLAKVYETILVPEWVQDAVTKPSRDLGLRTTATFTR